MDLLLESLKSIYEDMDDEQKLLQEIEDAILSPDEDPNDNDKLELKPIEPVSEPVSKIDEPVADPVTKVANPVTRQAPLPVPEPVAKSVAKPVSGTVPPNAPSSTKLPPISSKVPTPPLPKKLFSPDPVKTPNQPTDAPIDAPLDTEPDTALYGKVYNKLKKLYADGKPYRTSLNSTALNYLSYNPRNRNLNVTFTKNGRTYLYKNVGMKKVASLVASNSRGRYYNKDIKNAGHPSKELR